jgi:uncharacterized membrane protein
MKNIAREKLNECLGLAIFLLFSVMLYVASSRLPDFGVSNQSPGIFPAVVAMVMLLTCVIMLIRTVFKPSENNGNESRDESGSGQTNQIRANKVKLTLNLLIIIGYILLLGRVNFYLVTFLFLVILMSLLKAGSILKVFLISLGLVISLWVIFQMIFKIIMP